MTNVQTGISCTNSILSKLKDWLNSEKGKELEYVSASSPFVDWPTRNIPLPHGILI